MIFFNLANSVFFPRENVFCLSNLISLMNFIMLIDGVTTLECQLATFFPQRKCVFLTHIHILVKMAAWDPFSPNCENASLFSQLWLPGAHFNESLKMCHSLVNYDAYSHFGENGCLGPIFTKMCHSLVNYDAFSHFGENGCLGPIFTKV